MASYKKPTSLDELPHHVIIDEDHEGRLESWAFKSSLPRRLAVYIAGVLTCGMLFLVVFYWKPDWGLRLTHRKCPHDSADSLILKDIHQRNHRVSVFRRQIGNTGGDRLNSGTISETTINTVTRRELKVQDGALRYFKFQKAQFIWDSKEQHYFKLRGLTRDIPCSELYCYAGGLDDHQTMERQELYGLNEIRVKVRPILVLLMKEVMNPFYVFQLYTVAFWFAVEYIYYTVCIIVMSVISIAISLYTTRTESTRLRKMAKTNETVNVLRRDGSVETLSSSQLVPGDVIIIPAHGCHITCDAVLLAGNCVVNESMLTGESVQVTKTPLPNPQGSEQTFSMEQHKRHVLFCGTRVTQVKTHGEEVVKCVVIQTGFSTAKGQLVTSILYPKPTEIKLYRDALLFIVILGFIAFLGFIYTAVITSIHGNTLQETFLHALDIITIAIPPALPAVLTIGMVFAQMRLKKKNIYCISPQRINLCGTIDVVCFDKTGTLTEDGLDLSGVHPASNGCFSPMIPEARSLPPGNISVAMATCHELVSVGGEITGDPLDVKMFESSGWSLEFDDSNNEPVPDALVVARREASKTNYIGSIVSEEKGFSDVATLKIYPFASALQCMGVVVRDLSTEKVSAFVKGSPEKIVKVSNVDTVPKDFQEVMTGYTKQGLRLLALAWKSLDIGDEKGAAEIAKLQRDSVECDLEFLGLLIMQNKLKPATMPAIDELNEAQIRSIMVTGDNLFTAVTVGRQCGMVPPGATLLRLEVEPPDDHDQPCINITPLVDENRSVQNHFVISEMDGHDKSGAIVEDREEDRLLTIDGYAFGVIREHYPKLMPKIAAQGVIFARMSPDQKSQLVEALQGVGLSVGMCGDGANDCGALKQAHVGIALSQTEASVAAPFTSKEATIGCIPTVIKEGRCALVTSFGLFKYLAMYSICMFTAVTVLTSVQFYIGDMQFLVFDIILSTPFVLTVGANKAYDRISIERPLTRLVTPPIVFALIAQTLLQLVCLVLALLLIKNQPWYEPSPIDHDQRNVMSYENTAVFCVTNFIFVTYAFIYTPRPPFSNQFYRNIPVLIVFIADAFICFGFLYAPPDNIIAVVLMTDIPSYSFKSILLSLAVGHFIFAIIIEFLIAPSKKLTDFITCRLCRQTPQPIYQGVEMSVLRKPPIELMSDSLAVVV